ncbi:SusF/SusE family outer membrane protein [Robertkochia flava]|uniref:SusF/SusE family outer membrane protein n=1 Tax=Robertkochia flava TaxID=3447986 RepID=UPI001CC9FC5E|nr:SusF/SusE family outer membrane protein [Robertkochia marina]
MKKVFRTIKLLTLAAAMGLGFNSCDNEDYFEITAITPSEDITFTNSFAEQYLLSLPTANNVAERFVWNEPNFEAQTPVKYILEGSVNADFSSVDYSSGTIEANNQAVMVSNLIAMSEILGVDGDPATTDENGNANDTGMAYFKVTAFVGENGGANTITKESEPVSITFKVLEEGGEAPIPTIAVPGNHQGWSPSSAPLLAASEAGKTDYQGFVWLDGGHKFVGPDADGAFDWGNIDWGDDGTFTGKLLEQDEKDCIAEVAGYYLVEVDTDALTYKETLTSWGIIGEATPTGWDSDTDMTYDSETGTWSITMDLTAAAFKFRANDGWDINVGDNDADGSLEFGGSDIVVTEAGNYTITLDLSNPRAYTYSLTKN